MEELDSLQKSLSIIQDTMCVKAGVSPKYDTPAFYYRITFSIKDA